MKYVANPVEVDAFTIIEVRPASRVAAATLRVGDVVDTVEDGFVLRIGEWQAEGFGNIAVVHADRDMCARMTPKPGDYWVIQSDGYIYLNPKEVFERKYRRVPAVEVGTPSNA